MRRLFTCLFALSVAACAAQTDQPTIEKQEVSPPTGTVSCVTACRAALEICGSSPDDRAVVDDCAHSCPFSGEQLACLTKTPCGTDTSACY